MDEFASLNLIGRSPPFLAALALVSKFATCEATVLIQGETGTGKELAARAIHYLSRRRDLAFIPVNCGALPDNLIESELFGHVRGAFTDAKETRVGLVAEARGGTLYLDEIEAMSLRAQVALLRFLQDKEYRPIGGTAVRDSDLRIIASSNANLKHLVQQNAFRADLLFRLNVLSLHLPALRERRGDVFVVAEALLDRLNRRSGEAKKVLHPDSISVLDSYAWPGNVRELENLIQREFLLAPGLVIRITRIDDEQQKGRSDEASNAIEGFRIAKARVIAQFERAYITSLLSKTAGNISLASRMSGKDRSDINKLVRKHGLHREQFFSTPSRS